MARFSASLLAAAQCPAGDKTFLVMELDKPDGTTLRITDKSGGFQSATRGFYEQRIIGYPTGWHEGIGDTDNAMQIALMQVRLADDDWAFRNLVGKGMVLDNCPVRIYRAAPVEDVPTVAEWCQEYTGVLDDYPEGDGDSWNLSLRPDDAAMRSPILKRKAELYDWPNLPRANEGKYLPLIVGKHSYDGNANVEEVGAIALWSVDDTAHKYYVGLGYNNVLRVYDGATLLTLTTHYSLSYPLVNGVRHTIVTLVNAPNGEVRIDVEGQYALGTGTGAPVLAGIEATRLVLNQWVFPATPWTDGAWLAESARMHTTSWDAVALPFKTVAAGAAACSAIYIDDDRTGYDFVNQQCLSLGFHCYWRGDGTLAAYYDDPTTYAAITNQLKESDCVAFKISTSKDAILASSIGSWGLGKYELEVANPLAAGGERERIDLPGGPNSWP